MKKKMFAMTLLFCMLCGCLSEMESVKKAEAAAPVWAYDHNSGGKTLSDVIPGLSRANLMKWLGQHQNDSYYLGTPYNDDGDFRNPNGDPGMGSNSGKYGVDDVPWTPGMNCTGFVWHALWSGAYTGNTMSYSDAYRWIPCFSTTLAPGSAGGWVSFVRDNHLEYRHYQGTTVDEVIKEIITDGYTEPGDIIWSWDPAVGFDDQMGMSRDISDFHHVGIYIGKGLGGSSADLWWESTMGGIYDSWRNGNLLRRITPKKRAINFTVIKLDRQRTGNMELWKKSADTTTHTLSGYTLGGARYDVYPSWEDASSYRNSLGHMVTKTYTDKYGTNYGWASISGLPVGTYYVREVEEPMGYAKDENIYTVDVHPGKSSYVGLAENYYWIVETPEPGWGRLVKVSANPEITEGNACYSLAGATYGVYADAVSMEKDDRLATLVTDEKGVSNTVELYAGEYLVKEQKAPEGFNIHKESYTMRVTAGKTTTLSVSDSPRRVPADIEIYKIDADTGQPSAQGGASLEGAEFTVSYFDGYYDKTNLPATPQASWTIRTKAQKTGEKLRYIARLSEEYVVSGSDLYKIDGSPYFPLGTITVQETKASPGYKTGMVFKNSAGETVSDKNGVILSQMKGDNGNGTITGGNIYTQEEPVIRGDFRFRKEEADTKERLAEIPFQVTNTVTKESHIIVTDAKGEFNSEAVPHSRNTNGNDKVTNGKYLETGLWFSRDQEGNDAPVDDAKGALPYGEYRFEEIETEKTKGYNMLAFVINISDESNLDLGTKQNKKVEIKTTASGQTTGNHLERATEDITLVDRVTYKNVIVGKEYTIKGTLMDADTGEEFLDAAGKEITSEVKFVPEAEEGVAEILFSFKAVPEIAGMTTVVFEDMFDDGGRKVAAHGDLEDEDQTIHFVKIETSAKDQKTGCNTGFGGEKTTIIDTVAYENVIVGEEYIVKGVLMDSVTGEAYVDAEGKQVTSEARLTPTETKGTVDVIYEFNGTNLPGTGKKVVVFEELYSGETLIAEHKVLTDDKQTVYYPSIKTKAVGGSGENYSIAGKDVTIVDTVSYSGLQPHMEYTIKGILMDKDTGEPHVDAEGRKVTASVRFVPEAEEGSVDNTFFFPGENAKGKTLVVFEQLLIHGEVISLHEDLNDENQTIIFPEIKTSAKDKKTKSGVSVPETATTIIDTVTYTRLIPGKEYTVKGILMDADTGKPYRDAEGKEVTSSLRFTPEGSTGSVALEFVFHALNTKTRKVVVFEDVFDDKEFRVATHADITDENQTIEFPAMTTTASGKNGEKELPCDAEAVIYDEVAYTGLIKGARYKLKGTLMSKEKREPLTVKGSEITVEKEFTPEASSGKITVEYKVDACELERESVVVFEELYDKDDVRVIDHKDINDEGQTVRFTKTPEIPPGTGDRNMPIFFGIVLFCSGVALIIMGRSGRKMFSAFLPSTSFAFHFMGHVLYLPVDFFLKFAYARGVEEERMSRHHHNT